MFLRKKSIDVWEIIGVAIDKSPKGENAAYEFLDRVFNSPQDQQAITNAWTDVCKALNS